MPYTPNRTFIENIQAFYEEIDEPISYADAKRLAWRLLDISYYLAALKLPRVKEDVKQYYVDRGEPHPFPIPHYPEVAHPGKEATPDEAEPPEDLAELEPGDHPRPAQKGDAQVAAKLPF